MAKQANAVVLTFVEERETKNTIRFQEQVKGELDVPQIGTLYISKAMENKGEYEKAEGASQQPLLDRKNKE